MMLDAYYTPVKLSRELISKCTESPRLVGDFCAGDGGLLHACAERFPHATYVALDKAKRAVKKLIVENPKWEVYGADFLKEAQLDSIRGREGRFDLVLMNPPFSCRGVIYRFSLNEMEFTACRALLFVSRALKYVKPGGHLLAILPAGILHSQRDERLVRYLKRCYGFKVYGYASRVSFDGKMPNVFFVDLKRPERPIAYVGKAMVERKIRACFVRGSCTVMELAKSKKVLRGINYLHTTNLQAGGVVNLCEKLTAKGHRVVSGPAVLVPRVGNPTLKKVVVVRRSESYILSDCVLAILCNSNNSAITVRNVLVKSAKHFLSLYGGTGARYLTLRSLQEFALKNINAAHFRGNKR